MCTYAAPCELSSRSSTSALRSQVRCLVWVRSRNHSLGCQVSLASAGHQHQFRVWLSKRRTPEQVMQHVAG